MGPEGKDANGGPDYIRPSPPLRAGASGAYLLPPDLRRMPEAEAGLAEAACRP